MVKKFSSLVDEFGRPIEFDILDREIAAPSVSGLRSVLGTHPTSNIDPERMGRIMRDAALGLGDAYFDLAEEMEEKYPHYAGVLGTRKRQTAQLEITVESATDDKAHKLHADFIRDWLNRDTLQAELFDILDGIGKGISYTEIIWDMGTQWTPKQLKSRSQRWFEFDSVDLTTPMLKVDDGTQKALPPYKFIVHNHPAKTGLPIRSGLARIIAWPFLFQNMTVKDWVIFAEVYGMPLRLGKYGANATPSDKMALLRAVRDIGTDAAAIIPESMLIEFQNAAAAANADIYLKLASYLDQQVSKAVLGQTATTDALAGGLGGSQGNVHNDVRQDIQNADADLLATTLNRDLVRPMIDFNFGIPADGKYPKIRIGQSESLSQEQIIAIEKLVPLGLKIGMSTVRDRLGFPDPDADEEVLGIDAQKPPENPNLDPSRPNTRENSPSAFLEPSLPSKTAFSRADANPISASLPKNTETDPIDDYLDEFSDSDWQEVLGGSFEEITKAAADANSFEEFETKLTAALSKMDSSELVTRLSRASFFANLLGRFGDK